MHFFFFLSSYIWKHEIDLSTDLLTTKSNNDDAEREADRQRE